MDYDVAELPVSGQSAEAVSAQDPLVRSDLDFLARWEHMSPRDTGAMLRASLLRRTSPHLVRKAGEPDDAGRQDGMEAARSGTSSQGQ
ncbi:hypothetical protein AOE01nite_11150 [Acetobacter oeni]|uniref:Uncharacterized protein n=2 Tax=Acetobacter oeni TaxID=304077 RepID=A0A511XJ01_9PROT|nr:hypothetical protein AA21952_2076 [Acetobacter oeni LMG 21952]GEN62891.1 hypothetical protein AOE01nite_11150 [Acetobacter oeni]